MADLRVETPRNIYGDTANADVALNDSTYTQILAPDAAGVDTDRFRVEITVFDNVDVDILEFDPVSNHTPRGTTFFGKGLIVNEASDANYSGMWAILVRGTSSTVRVVNKG